MYGYFASFAVSAASSVKRNGSSILDCPPQIQTSPTITSWNSAVCWPSVTVSVYGPPVGGGAIFTCQRPSAPATPVALSASIRTWTESPGLDQPQMASGLPLWRTMLSPNMVLTNGSGPVVAFCASAQPDPARRLAIAAAILSFISPVFLRSSSAPLN